MIPLKPLCKQPSEVLVRRLVDGAVAAIASSAVTSRGLVAGSAALDATFDLSDAIATVAIGAGSDGEQYLITAVLELVDGDSVEVEIEVTVIDAAWTMPSGGAGYLTIAEFVDMFGLPEVVRMTDAGDGRIDRAYLVAALRAAQGEVDLNLSARYQVPLTGTIPDAIRTAVADIARARLYPRGLPDGVVEAAKAARAGLVRIAKGEVPLPLPANEVAPSAEPDAPIAYYSGGRTYPDGLSDY